MSEEGLKPVWSAIKCELRDTSPAGDYKLARILIGVNLVFFMLILPVIYTNSGVLGEGFRLFKYLPLPACVASGGCLPQVIISMFGHAGLVHLLGNMFFLYIVGDNVEAVLGKAKMIFIYITAGVFGAVVQSLVIVAESVDKPILYMIGASAAISGLIGAYLVYYPGSLLCRCLGFVIVYYCFRIRASSYLAIWIVFQLLVSQVSVTVAVWAHIAGLLIGIALARLLADHTRIDELRNQIAQGIYRGPSIGQDELHKPSISPIVQLLVLIAFLGLVMSQVLALPTLLELDDKYYTIYADASLRTDGNRVLYRVESIRVEVMDKPPDHLTIDVKGRDYRTPYAPIIMTTLIKARETTYTLTLTPVYLEWINQGTVVLASYKLSYLKETSIATLLLTILVGILAMHTLINEPHRYEITYMPADMIPTSPKENGVSSGDNNANH